jgi:hypothetical protein
VHLISGSATWIEWDLAEPSTRDAVISDAIAFTNAVILPFFQQFEQPESVVESLAGGEISSAFDASIVEFALCFSGSEKAQDLLHSFVGARRIPLPDIESALTRQDVSATARPVKYAEQVAWLKSSYGLK